jgi:hypothetical protein
VAQDFPPDHRENDEPTEFERWLAKAPTAAIARVVLQLDEAVTLKRRAARGDAVPPRPIKPSGLELAVIIALAETYGAALYRDARFIPVIDHRRRGRSRAGAARDVWRAAGSRQQ